MDKDSFMQQLISGFQRGASAVAPLVRSAAEQAWKMTGSTLGSRSENQLLSPVTSTPASTRTVTPTPTPISYQPPKTYTEWQARGYDKKFPKSDATIRPVSTPSSTPAPTVAPFPVSTNKGGGFPDPQEIARKIRAGYAEYSKGVPLPALDHVDQFVQATQQYPFFAKNPYLLPQIAILETSGGRNITRPNNLLNWGINVPGNNEAFSKMTPAEVVARAISGLGQRSPYYNEIRQTNDLQKFAKIYEPTNDSYYNALTEGFKLFERQ